MNTIEIHDLVKNYTSGGRKIQALGGVNLEIGEGLFGLLGPEWRRKNNIDADSGRHRTAFLRPGFRLRLGIGTEKERIAIKAMLGYLPQELGMYPDLSARQFVDYMAILKGMDEKWIRSKRVKETLEMVGLGDAADRKLKGFSGGMKRRVGIAQALINDPKVLIVDEPTAGLDPEERIRFRNLLVDLAADRVVILSTHIVEDIGQTSRDMAVLAAGNVIFRGSPQTLISEARGKVWTVTLDQPRKPNNGLAVLSMLHLAEGTQYRLVGEDISAYPGAVPTEPGLEDSYVWLMKRTGLNIDAVRNGD